MNFVSLQLKWNYGISNFPCPLVIQTINSFHCVHYSTIVDGTVLMSQRQPTSNHLNLILFAIRNVGHSLSPTDCTPKTTDLCFLMRHVSLVRWRMVDGIPFHSSHTGKVITKIVHMFELCVCVHLSLQKEAIRQPALQITRLFPYVLRKIDKSSSADVYRWWHCGPCLCVYTALISLNLCSHARTQFGVVVCISRSSSSRNAILYCVNWVRVEYRHRVPLYVPMFQSANNKRNQRQKKHISMHSRIKLHTHSEFLKFELKEQTKSHLPKDHNFINIFWFFPLVRDRGQSATLYFYFIFNVTQRQRCNMMYLDWMRQHQHTAKTQIER